ncbi:hypothetical protein GCM10009560_47600 [Nonomuraea longicatena]|uniref:Uncharacterized protein n=2 Tax=Nonomuraea longicatena TaxID=83682 RepID=A0ABN1Q5C7_9ACTN
MAWNETVDFSADGRLLAVSDYLGRVTVFRFDGVEFTNPGHCAVGAQHPQSGGSLRRASVRTLRA